MQIEHEGGNVNRRGLLGRLVRAVYQPPPERERVFYRRLRELSEAIEEAPDSITLLVLRGEHFLERGEYERAKFDFEAAATLAEDMDDRRSWLLVEQVMRDRALYGLRVVERRI
ncbi:MAG: hypothetical protein OXG78_00540 [Chloroflexi bacterium]|nr:hypothetical protein [Chloroflexota bacterium]